MDYQANQAPDHEYKIYILSTRQFVPVSKEIYLEYHRPIWRIQKQARKHGRCTSLASRLWQCDGDCLVCRYRSAGDTYSLDYLHEGENGKELSMLDTLEDPSVHIEDQVTDAIVLQQLLMRLEELFPGGRRIIKLRMEGVPDRDIADIVGIPRTTFRSRIEKVKALLRAEFGDII